MSESMDRKIVFKRMTERDKFEALFDMVMSANSIITKHEADMIALKNMIEHLEHEMEGIGYRRTDDSVTTTEKLNAIVDRRFLFWRPIAQHVMGVIIDIVILAVLYMAFGNKP